ncbi:DUF1203 domain-containing protein [Lutimaribacter marinistellae]|uniref:DUF1203 domain-containing protein n=1 Tax=Lutimaribacter marinistellae TaxID=1820329 RepID=A0ABV7TJD3_9RHOB
MTVRFTAIPTDRATALRRGGPDAHGQRPERKVATSEDIPCRHCMNRVTGPYLVLAYSPFTTTQPYAETGPIFICADDCPSGTVDGQLPGFLTSDSYITRGYDEDERIVYGTGGVTATGDILARCRELLSDPGIAFVHIRSASNNCFHVRADRAG